MPNVRMCQACFGTMKGYYRTDLGAQQRNGTIYKCQGCGNTYIPEDQW